MKIVFENRFSGKSYFYTIASSPTRNWRRSTRRTWTTFETISATKAERSLLNSEKYRVVQLDFTTEVEVFYMMFDRSLSILVGHLSNSIWNTSISGVKLSWTTLYSLFYVHSYLYKYIFTSYPRIIDRMIHCIPNRVGKHFFGRSLSSPVLIERQFC